MTSARAGSWPPRFLTSAGGGCLRPMKPWPLGFGGVPATALATGIARSTINRGIDELQSARNDIDQRVRRPGAGRKSAVAHHPGLPAALEGVIEAAIRGDPCAPLRWVSRSQRQLVKALADLGFTASQRVVANLLRELNYSCQANSKTREGGQHPDRDAQFAHINATVKAAIIAGEPAISVDTKKKELVGDFKNNGRELRPKGQPEAVRVHDFKIPALALQLHSPFQMRALCGGLMSPPPERPGNDM